MQYYEQEILSQGRVSQEVTPLYEMFVSLIFQEFKKCTHSCCDGVYQAHFYIPSVKCLGVGLGPARTPPVHLTDISSVIDV